MADNDNEHITDEKGEVASRISRYLQNAEAEKIGGVIVVLLGEQGAGKTVALANKGAIDIDHGRVVFWRGQPTCQWLLLACYDIPITLWMHEWIEEPEFFKSVEKGQTPTFMQPEALDDLEGLDVKVERFSDPSTLVNQSHKDRINVYYVPGFGADNEKDKYGALSVQAGIMEELNDRIWLQTGVTLLTDEVGEVHPMEQTKPIKDFTEDKMPAEEADFRKNGVTMLSAAHDTSQVHYKLHKNQAAGVVYMRGSNVKQRHSEVKQDIIANLKRGHFVIPAGGYVEKDKFEMIPPPDKKFKWLKDGQKLRMRYRRNIPDLT